MRMTWPEYTLSKAPRPLTCGLSASATESESDVTYPLKPHTSRACFNNGDKHAGTPCTELYAWRDMPQSKTRRICIGRTMVEQCHKCDTSGHEILPCNAPKISHNSTTSAHQSKTLTTKHQAKMLTGTFRIDKLHHVRNDLLCCRTENAAIILFPVKLTSFYHQSKMLTTIDFQSKLLTNFDLQSKMLMMKMVH